MTHRAADPGAGLLSGRGVVGFVGEWLCAALLAGVVAMAVQKIVGLIPMPRPSAVPTALTALVAVLVVGASVALLARPGWGLLRTGVAWVLPAAGSAAIQALVFSGSRFYLNGTNDDQLFRMQLFVRMATSLGTSDGNYADLPSFYPVGWFWLGGRFANLAGLEPWAAYKPFSIATMAVAPALAYVLWSRVVGRRRALPVSLAVVATGLTVEAYEPYRWVVVVLLPPAVALAVAEFRRRVQTPASRRPSGVAIVVGLVLGIALGTYTLMFGVLLLALVLTVLLVVGDGARDVSSVLRGLGRILPAGGVILVVGGIVGAPVWAPYLAVAVSRPSAGNGAARYFPDGSAVLPFPMFEPTVLGLVALGGTVWLVFGRSFRVAAVGCTVTAVTCYVWHVLSTLLLSAGTSLLAVIVDSLLALALAIATVLGLGEIADLPGDGHSVQRARLSVVLVGAALFVALVQAPSPLVADRLEATFAASDDEGRDASGGPAVPDETLPGSWNGQVIGTIDTLTGRPPDSLVLLTDDWPVLALRPYRSFQTIVQEYANPLALFPARRAEIEDWATARTPDALLGKLARSPFRTPDVFVLRRTAEGYAIQVSTNRFPLSATNDFRNVVFSPAAFSGAAFQRLDVGPFVTIARR